MVGQDRAAAIDEQHLGARASGRQAEHNGSLFRSNASYSRGERAGQGPTSQSAGIVARLLDLACGDERDQHCDEQTDRRHNAGREWQEWPAARLRLLAHDSWLLRQSNSNKPKTA